MKKLKQFIPNLLTLGNLFCGCLAIYFIFKHDQTNYYDSPKPNVNTAIYYAIGLIFLSLLLDFLDGFVARLLDTKSALGAQLDSLADVVSFGVVPGFLMLTLIDHPFLQFSSFLLPVFAAYRLAKFNIDSEQATYFKGLATPAMTLFAIGLFFSLSGLSLKNAYFNTYIPLIIIVLCYLMISNIPLFSLKVNSLGWKDNWYRYVLLLGSIAALACLGLSAFVFIIPAYIVLSVVVKRQFV